MHLRQFVRTSAVSAALALAFAAAAPALAHGEHEPGTAPAAPDTRPDWNEARRHHPSPSVDPRARDEWLGECRRRLSGRDNGVGGAVIGGLVGGIAGNRIAGRGNRTVGTVAGAAVGAVAGMAIDKAEDRGRVRDQCETYLDDYYAYYARAGHGYGYAQPAGYGYAASGCCQPVAMAPVRRAPECTETVEYVYEDVPVRPKARRIPAKRVKIVPDKRVQIK